MHIPGKCSGGKVRLQSEEVKLESIVDGRNRQHVDDVNGAFCIILDVVGFPVAREECKWFVVNKDVVTDAT